MEGSRPIIGARPIPNFSIAYKALGEIRFQKISQFHLGGAQPAKLVHATLSDLNQGGLLWLSSYAIRGRLINDLRGSILT